MKASDDSLLSAIEEQPGEADEDNDLSPTSKLRKKMQARSQSTSAQQRRRNRMPPIRREMIQYETFTVVKKEMSVLEWWKGHETILPILSKVAKKVLTVPASSSKSERVFSTGKKSYRHHHHGRCSFPPAPLHHCVNHYYNQVGTLSPRNVALSLPRKLRSCV